MECRQMMINLSLPWGLKERRFKNNLNQIKKANLKVHVFKYD